MHISCGVPILLSSSSDKLNVFELLSHNRLPNFDGRLSIPGHLIGKEDLLDAELSTGAVLGRITVKKASVSNAVAHAVARLLRQHCGDFAGNGVCTSDDWVGESLRG